MVCTVYFMADEGSVFDPKSTVHGRSGAAGISFACIAGWHRAFLIFSVMPAESEETIARDRRVICPASFLPENRSLYTAASGPA
jgi:hypothetical protein